MRPEQQESSEVERRTVAVSTKVTPEEHASLHFVAGARKRNLSSMVRELAVEPLLAEAERVRTVIASAEG